MSTITVEITITPAAEEVITRQNLRTMLDEFIEHGTQHVPELRSIQIGQMILYEENNQEILDIHVSIGGTYEVARRQGSAWHSWYMDHFPRCVSAILRPSFWPEEANVSL